MPWSTIPSQEEDGSRREQWTVDGMNASVTLRCGWDVRHSLAADMIGNRKLYPSAPGPAGPFATTASIVPGDSNYVGSDEMSFYETALVTIGYDNRQPVDAFSESIEPTVSFLTTSPKKLVWGADATGPKVEDRESPSVLFRGLNFVQTRFNIAPPLPPALLTSIGGVNDAAYVSTILGLTFAPETLLFVPPSINRTIKTDGTGTYTISTKFSYQPQGWNTYYRTASGEWEGMFYTGDPDATPPVPAAAFKGYPLKDFSSLLQ